MSLSEKAASHTTKTIYGIKNEMHSCINVPYEADTEMTLNFKYKVGLDTPLTSIPTLRYFGIGIKGCYNVDDGNLSSPYIPKETNADLFEPIPFRCVPVEQDLSSTERSMYRMRVRKTVGLQDYWLYYLKKMEITSGVNITMVNPDPNIKTELPYDMNTANLSPIPVKPDTSGIITGSVSEINVSVKALMTVTGQEVAEAIGVLYSGDLRYAKVSEFGLYTGEDREIIGYTHLNQQFSYTESIHAQLAAHHTNMGTDMSHRESIEKKYLAIGSGSLLVL